MWLQSSGATLSFASGNFAGMNAWRIVLWVALVLLLLGFFWLVRGVLPPFVLSLVIAALLEPLIRKLRKAGVSRPLAVIAVLVLFFGSVGALVSVSAVQIRQQYDAAQTQITAQVNNIATGNPDEVLSSIDTYLEKNKATLTALRLPLTRQEIVAKYIDPNRKEFEKKAQSFVSGGFFSILSFASQAFMFLLVPVFVFGLLIDLESMRKSFARFIPPTIRGGTLSMLGDMGGVFQNYLRGLVVTILLYTLLMGTVLGIIGAPYFIVLALIAGTLYLIPVIGGILSSVVIFVAVGLSGQTKGLLFTTDNSWMFAVYTVAILFVFGFIYDSVVNPRIVGKAVKLNPVLSAFVVFSAGALFGLPGMLLAYPVAGAIKVVLDRLVKFTGSTEDRIKLQAVPLRHRQVTTG